MVACWVLLRDLKLNELWNVSGLCFDLDGLVLEVNNGSTHRLSDNVNWNLHVNLLTLFDLY